MEASTTSPTDTRAELRERIRGASDIREQVISVPEWDNAEILVRGLTGFERASFIKRVADQQTGVVDPERAYPAIMVAACFDPSSRVRLFVDADRDWLMSKSGAALDRVATLALDLSGLSQEMRQAARGNSNGVSAEGTSRSPGESDGQ